MLDTNHRAQIELTAHKQDRRVSAVLGPSPDWTPAKSCLAPVCSIWPTASSHQLSAHHIYRLKCGCVKGKTGSKCICFWHFPDAVLSAASCLMCFHRVCVMRRLHLFAHIELFSEPAFFQFYAVLVILPPFFRYFAQYQIFNVPLFNVNHSMNFYS